MNEWKPIFHEQLELFRSANLTPATYVLGTEDDKEYVSQHLPVIGWQNNLGWYETPTLDEVFKWSHANPGGAAIYCHSKGVSSPSDEGKACWRRLMGREVIAPWCANIARLDSTDAMGVNLQNMYGHAYFEGNFWIARADWISHLSPPWEHRGTIRPGWLRPERFHAESWLLSKPFYKAESLLCRGTYLADKTICESLLNPPSPQPKPELPDDEIRRLIKHAGATDRLPERLKARIDEILRACQCNFRRDFDPLIPQVRPYFST